MSGQIALFWLLAVVSVCSALLVVLHRNPVRSALFLVMNFFVLALLYLTLSAQFIAAVQVIVYAGAIMVLFLFTIMLLNLGAPNALTDTRSIQKPTAIVLALAFVTILTGTGMVNSGMAASHASSSTLSTGGTVQTVGLALFDANQPWLFPFEVTSVLLLIGVVGAIVMAKRRI